MRVLRLRTPEDETTPCMDGVQTLFCLTEHRQLSGMECANARSDFPSCSACIVLQARLLASSSRVILTSIPESARS